MRTKHHNTSWILLLLAAMTIIVFWPLYSGEYTLRGEAVDLLIPVFSHIREALWQGEWPLWNKYQYQGIATSVFPVYWNPAYLLLGGLFSSPDHALNALYLMLILLSGLGFYKLSGLFLKDKQIVMVGGLCYPLLGFFVVQSPFIDLITAAAWLPLLLYTSLRYQENGKSRYLILLAIGYYLFVAGTSAGFVVCITAVIVAQILYGLLSKNYSIHRSLYSLAALLPAGFLVWRIYWIRWQSYIPTPDFRSITTSVSQSLHDLSSLVLSKTTAAPTEFLDQMGPVHFHSFAGIIVLFLAIYTIWHSRTKTDQKLGYACFLFLVISIVVPLMEKIGLQSSGLSGLAITSSVKILFTASLLILGLRGLQKINSDPKSGQIFFLVLAIIFAGIALFANADSALTSWFLQMDLWKSTFFLLLTSLLLWVRQPNLRFLLISGLVIAELGLSSFLNQDGHLYNEYPSSVFSSQISFPEKKTKPVNLTSPVGRYSDKDFKIASLDRNTGTLFKEVVRDGYWPWRTISQEQFIDSLGRQKQLRYPLFYFSKDTTLRAMPSFTNFDDPIIIRSQTDHRWKLSLKTRYEKYLVFNQNYDKNWTAEIDNEQIPVLPTSSGMMKIPLSPGLHIVTLLYRTDGLLNICGGTMIVLMILVIMMLIKEQFPYSILILTFPVIAIFLISPDMEPATHPEQVIKQDSADYEIDYEGHAPFWFARTNQITPENSFDGYRSESLSQHGEYSATLQIPRNALNNKKELEYKFHIYPTEPIEAAVVLKTYTETDESYNIQYITSLNTGKWRTIEGRFSLEGLQGPLIKAEFFIWNHQKKDFLIDDIQVKLNP